MKIKPVLTLLFISVWLLNGCLEDETDFNPGCISSSLISGWNTESFNDEYDIQFPTDYKGQGDMAHFEGHLFHKYNADSTIVINTYFCDPLYCPTYSSEITFPFPASVQHINPDSTFLTLEKGNSLCINDTTLGVIYFNHSPGVAEIYLRTCNDSCYKQAANIYYGGVSNYPEVENFFSTIH